MKSDKVYQWKHLTQKRKLFRFYPSVYCNASLQKRYQLSGIINRYPASYIGSLFVSSLSSLHDSILMGMGWYTNRTEEYSTPANIDG